MSVALARIALAKSTRAGRVEGDLVETGVYTGGVTIALLDVLDSAPSERRKMYACDSFRGLPERRRLDNACGAPKLVPNRRCQHVHGRGAFSTSRATFEANVNAFGVGHGGRLRTVAGWFNESLPPATLGRIAVLRLDGDLHASTRDAL